MTGIVLVIVLAIIVEAVVEYAKNIGKALLEGKWKTAGTQLGAVALSVTLCFAAGGDIFAIIGLQFAWPWLGVVLTGIVTSRGANYTNDFIQRLKGVNKE